MSQEAPNILAHTEQFPHSPVNSAEVFWDYLQKAIQINVGKAAHM